MLASQRKPLSFFLSFSSTSVLNFPDSLWTSCLLGFLPHPSMLSRLRYSTLFQLALFVAFSHTALSDMAGNPVFGSSLLYVAISIFSRQYLSPSGNFPSSALNFVLLVVLVQLLSSELFPAVFTNFAFPSLTSPAHSSSSTIAYIRIRSSLSPCVKVRVC